MTIPDDCEHLRVRSGQRAIDIEVEEIEWLGPGEPRSTWRRARRLPADATEREVKAVMDDVLRDPQWFRQCEVCEEIYPLGHMLEHLCHGCAERTLGVRF